MNYCEKCNFSTNEEYCPSCGNKKLRPVNDNDFCLLLEKDKSYCRFIIDIFKKNKIKYSAVPSGSGVRSQFGLLLENYKLYVEYKSLEKAIDIIKDIENHETEELREYLLNNTNQLNITGKLKKKIVKKFKLSENQNFLEFCIDIIKSSNRIIDNGNITGYVGHYYLCQTDNIFMTINSKTFEILSISAKK